MEYLDIVDDKDNVVGKTTIDQIYEKNLIHRIVHILIFNDNGEMALQLRSKHKKFCPHHWSTAVGGHVQSGETYEQAAHRECLEELGKENLIIDKVAKHRYKNKFVVTFKATYNGPFTINQEEVDEVRFFAIPKIKELIKNHEKFHPELAFLIEQLYRH